MKPATSFSFHDPDFFIVYWPIYLSLRWKHTCIITARVGKREGVGEGKNRNIDIYTLRVLKNHREGGDIELFIKLVPNVL